MAQGVEKLEGRRAEILEEIEGIGDMRRGSIVERYRQCGKHPCCCEDADHPGHGPYYSMTVKSDGRTVTRHLAPGAQLSKVQREIEAFRHFQELVPEFVRVNEELCAMRPVQAESGEQRTLKKKWSKPFRRKSPAKSSGS